MDEALILESQINIFCSRSSVKLISTSTYLNNDQQFQESLFKLVETSILILLLILNRTLLNAT